MWNQRPRVLLDFACFKQIAIVGAVILHGFPSHLEMNMQLVKQPLHGICVVVCSSFDFIVVLVILLLLIMLKNALT